MGDPRVIIHVGPKGRIKKGGVEFLDGSASIITGGRLQNWLPQLVLAAKSYRIGGLLKRKYGVEKDSEGVAEVVKPAEVSKPTVKNKKEGK